MTGDGPAFAPEAAEDIGGFVTQVIGRHAPIAEQVSARIIAMIKSGNLRPGDRLPTETRMAVAFGISRPALREALKALTIMGMLESRQGGRYSVTDLSPARLVAPFSAMLAVSDYDIEAHFEARILVDLELARLCALRATTAERQHLLRLAQDGRSFHDDPIGFRLHDAQFHGAIADGARSPLIATLSESLYQMQIDLRRRATTLPGVIAISVAQHCALAEAILAGDPDQAADLTRRHLAHVHDSTERAMADAAEERAPGAGPAEG